jgi:ferredoxin
MTSVKPKRKIARVIIVEGCTVSNACEMTCPEVFHVLETGVTLRAGAHTHFIARREAIEKAADGCPLGAIQIEYEDGSLLTPGR